MKHSNDVKQQLQIGEYHILNVILLENKLSQ